MTTTLGFLDRIRRALRGRPDELIEALRLLDAKEAVVMARMREHCRLADEEINQITRNLPSR